MIRLLKTELDRLVLTLGNKPRKTVYAVTLNPKEYMDFVLQSLEDVNIVMKALRDGGFKASLEAVPDSPETSPPVRPWISHEIHELLDNTDLPFIFVDDFRPEDGGRMLKILVDLGFGILRSLGKNYILYDRVITSRTENFDIVDQEGLPGKEKNYETVIF